MKLKKLLKLFNTETYVEVNDDDNNILYEGSIFTIPKSLLKCKIDSERECYICQTCYSDADAKLTVYVINKIYLQQ